MNPCPCVFFGDPTKECTDSLAQVMRYQNRISGPMLDRFDIHVEVPRVDYEKLSSDRTGEPSAKIRERVEQARERQHKRFAGTSLQCNGDMVRGGQKILRSGRCWEELATRRDATDANERAGMSSHPKIGADGSGSRGPDKIETTQIAEAIQYRSRKQL
jgi:magnesium chelatase family protein